MAELVTFQLLNDAACNPHGLIINPSKQVNAYVLAPDTPKTIAKPAGARIALFSFQSGANIYVAYDTVAVVPSSDITDGTSPELNPGGRDVVGFSFISMISGSNTVATVSFLT